MTQSSFSRKQIKRLGLMKKASGKVSHVHEQVAEVAKELTKDVYELAMSNNQFRADFKEVHSDCLLEKQLVARFVEINWSQLIPAARATLAGMLRGPYDDAFKESIMEALSLDAGLVRGRQSPAFAMPAKQMN